MSGKTNGLSIAGFVISLVSLCILNPFTGTVGLILSAIGKSQAIHESGKTELATAGVVMGIICIIFGLRIAIA